MARIRARYAVKGPRKEKVTFNHCWMDEDTKSLQQEVRTEERDCYMVYFPQGHSIRVTSFEQLKEMGYHLKPRMVDMETGDVVDVGGDPYDFANNPQGETDLDITLMDDNDVERNKPARTKVRSE